MNVNWMNEQGGIVVKGFACGAVCAVLLFGITSTAAWAEGPPPPRGTHVPVESPPSSGGSDLFSLYPLLGLPTVKQEVPVLTVLQETNDTGWLGIAPRETKPVFLPGADDFTPALRVHRVYPGSTADKAGLLVTDRIVAVNNEPLQLGAENSLVVHFKNRVAQVGAGGNLELKLLRGEGVMDLALTLDPIPTHPPVLPVHPELDRLHAEARETFFLQTLEREGMKGEFKKTLRAMKTASERVLTTAFAGGEANPFRLGEVNYVLHRPMDLPWLAHLLTRSVHRSFSAETQRLGSLVRGGLEALGVEKDADDSVLMEKAYIPPTDLGDFIDRLAKAMNEAEILRRESFAKLTVEEIQMLEEGIRDWLFQDLVDDALDRTEIEKREMEDRFLKWFEIAIKVDRHKLLVAGKRIAEVLDLQWLKSWKQSGASFRPFREGWVVREERDRVAIRTAGITIVVGDGQSNLYSEDADVIIDLGGDDRYLNTAGASQVGRRNMVVIDLDGDDLYLSRGWSRQGAGLLGAGFLLDLGGNDRYVTDHFSQGAGFLGVGVLVDTGGQDRYQCQVFCQGAGFLGIGILADGGGDDAFSNAIYGQGLGATGGYGLLVDAAGQDRYTSGGSFADYSEPILAFRSMAQGVGLGHDRWDSLIQLSGGIGILSDQNGNDTYVADYFAQGTGKTYGLGILHDENGDDRYLAGRYAQGTGMRQGAGLLLDGHGDDDYLSHAGVSQGVGHETGVGMLIDRAGDDRFTSSLLSQGAGNGNGIGLLVDTDGDDEYACRDLGQGFGLFDPVAGQGGFGFLFDTGGGNDRYSLGRGNDGISKNEGWGLSADLH
ncbi:conserved exported hypothetical protein [Nitrospina gracilis 3/211]|uniref:PDZ domain-containing protein n=1 Tax=Nitrospina gracilis (strain 3/211) TaxID=1266370 RepID=M1YXT2_NITG3|nr:conserved exported hypothetical protein [Nitrospina gracilis 3/211]